MKKQSIILVIIISIAITLLIGYVIFSETVDDNTHVVDIFDIEFTKIGEINSKGYTPVAYELATISNDKNAVVINVNKLDYPGAYVEIPITITNVGALDATLKAINVTGWNINSSPIIVGYSGIEIGETIKSNKSKIITIRVEWLSTDNTLTYEPENPYENPQFTITLDYEQSYIQTK